MNKLVECYNENEFKTKHGDLYWKIGNILNGIPGKWVFSQYIVEEYDIIHYHICFGDEDDEDRTFTMEWNNRDTPYEKAHIEVSTD